MARQTCVFDSNLCILFTSGRRRGQAIKSESDEKEEDDINDSDSSDLGPPAVSAIFAGARPSHTVSDDGDDDNQDENSSGAEDDNNDFIVEDGDADVPELPTVFSMGTFQVQLAPFRVPSVMFTNSVISLAGSFAPLQSDLSTVCSLSGARTTSATLVYGKSLK